MPNKYEGSGELAAVIAERDALRAENDLLKQKVHNAHETGYALTSRLEAHLAKAREALQAITEWYPMAGVSERAVGHQAACKALAAVARQTLKEICDANT